jgi:phasin family protein
VGKVMTVIGPKESLRSLDDLAFASLELALADIRELAELAANSQREAFDIVKARVTANIDEVQQLLRK